MRAIGAVYDGAEESLVRIVAAKLNSFIVQVALMEWRPKSPPERTCDEDGAVEDRAHAARLSRSSSCRRMYRGCVGRYSAGVLTHTAMPFESRNTPSWKGSGSGWAGSVT